MILWLAFMGILGMGGIVYSVANPPTEPVVHCLDPVNGATYHYLQGSCSKDWVQYNPGDEKSALDLHLQNIIEAIH